MLAIVPLAALLSRATESVAAKTGDAVGGLLNATLGNLTELVIALTALRGGQYMLVKASIAGAIVTNTLFMLGAPSSWAASGITCRSSTGSAPGSRPGCCSWPRWRCWFHRRSWGPTRPAAGVGQILSVGLSVLLIAAYALGLLFSLRTHRAEFASAAHEQDDETPWPLGLALSLLAGVTVVVALVSEVFVNRCRARRCPWA